MRVMMIVKASRESEAGEMPSEELLAAMARYNEELVKAGVMLDGAGLKPSSAGARVRFVDGQPHVVDGPFAETKELIAGYWILQVSSFEEALEWARRAPAPHPHGQGEIELRPYFELEDFGESPAVEAHRDVQQQMDARKER